MSSIDPLFLMIASALFTLVFRMWVKRNWKVLALSSLGASVLFQLVTYTALGRLDAMSAVAFLLPLVFAMPASASTLWLCHVLRP